MVNLGEAYRKLIGKTNKRRTKNEQKTVRAARADEGKTKEERCELHGQIEKKRIKEVAIRTSR